MASHPDARVARGRIKAAIAMFALCHVLQARDMRSSGCARRPPPLISKRSRPLTSIRHGVSSHRPALRCFAPTT